MDILKNVSLSPLSLRRKTEVQQSSQFHWLPVVFPSLAHGQSSELRDVILSQTS